MRISRSRKVHLVLLASTAIGLTGCGDNNDQQAQEQPKGETVQADLLLIEPGKCEDMGLRADGTGTRTFTHDECVGMEQEAKRNFAQTAPLYENRETCVYNHGVDNCPNQLTAVERDGTTTVGYQPLLAGFVLGTGAALAAAHIVNGMAANAAQPNPRVIPVYTSPTEKCRVNPQDPDCRRGSTGGGGGGGGGSRGYVYGYNGYTMAAPSSTPGGATATVSRTASGSFAPVTTARAGFGGSTVGGARGGIGATARGGFGASAGGHAGGGGHGGGGT